MTTDERLENLEKTTSKLLEINAAMASTGGMQLQMNYVILDWLSKFREENLLLWRTLSALPMSPENRDQLLKAIARAETKNDQCMAAIQDLLAKQKSESPEPPGD